MSCHSAGAYTATLLVMVNVMKGGGRAPLPSPAWANFTLMMECAPESSRCYSVYSVQLPSPQSTYTHRIPQDMCPRRNSLGLPHPLSRKRVSPPPRTKWEGTEGGGESQFQRLKKMPSTLSTLCPSPSHSYHQLMSPIDNFEKLLPLLSSTLLAVNLHYQFRHGFRMHEVFLCSQCCLSGSGSGPAN